METVGEPAPRNRRYSLPTPEKLLELVTSEGWQLAFWKKVAKTEGGCWNWTGAASSGRCKDKIYGNITVGGGTTTPHRISWIISRRETPSGPVQQKCGNTLCVNPEHLCLRRRSPQSVRPRPPRPDAPHQSFSLLGRTRQAQEFSDTWEDAYNAREKWRQATPGDRENLASELKRLRRLTNQLIRFLEGNTNDELGEKEDPAGDDGGRPQIPAAAERPEGRQDSEEV